MTRTARLLGAVCTVLTVACGGDTTMPPGGDSGMDAASVGADAGRDGGAADAGPNCSTAADCQDDQFCNGAELCMPGAVGADARGCTHAGSPCTGTVCNEATDVCEAAVCTDADGDGARSVACGGDDCDDGDPNRFPGNPELCDAAGHDEDCDPASVGTRDADADGYTSDACCNARGTVSEHCGNDCNDADPGVHPTESEVCDGLDNDCDTVIDETVRLTFYRDLDGDSFGQTDMTREGCSLLTGYAFVGGDCADMNPAVHPSAAESCDGIDNDCDGRLDDPGCPCTIGMTYQCGPRDGAGAFITQGICRTGTQDCAGSALGDCVGRVDPAAEACNAADDDCDGMTDEAVTNPYYQDLDGDGHGNPLVVMQACAAPLGYVVLSDDCNDALASVRPGALETCNMVDDNCNGTADEGVQLTFYRDIDGDGYGQSAMVSLACAAPSGYVAMSGDCDDGSSAVFPLAPESCANMIDDNCSGTINEGCACTAGQIQTCGTPDPAMPMQFLTTGVCATGMQTCSSGGQWQMCSGNVAPSAEVCNAMDDDCDAIVDESTRISCYPDADDDGYAATGATSSLQCRTESRAAVGYCPSMYTNRAPSSVATTDCNDGNSAINPSIAEMCSFPAVDQNCNGNADEGYVTCFVDADGDGFAATGASSLAPACPATGGYGGCSAGYTSRNPATGGNADCDPADAAQNPLASESCNFEDDDCDGTVDDGFLEMRSYYTDNDADTYGTTLVSVTVSSCRAASYLPTGYASRGGDCCDSSNHAFPGSSWWSSTARCGSFDFNCDGTITHYTSSLGAACACYGTGCSPGGLPSPPSSVWECYTGAAPGCGAPSVRCACGTTGCTTTCSSRTATADTALSHQCR